LDTFGVESGVLYAKVLYEELLDFLSNGVLSSLELISSEIELKLKTG
jgi:hypothetical protein